MNNKEKFCKAANQFLWNRGYDSKMTYFQMPINTSIGSDELIYFYYAHIMNYSHPNGKRFESPINELKEQYIKWIVELIHPIMKKYDIIKEQLF